MCVCACVCVCVCVCVCGVCELCVCVCVRACVTYFESYASLLTTGLLFFVIIDAWGTLD